MTDDLSWAGFGRAMLVLALVWWAWSAFAWATNAQDPDAAVFRATLLLATVPDLHRRTRAATRIRTRRHPLCRRVRRRPLPAPRALRGRLPPRQRITESDRRLLDDRRDRHGAAHRGVVRECTMT